MVEPILSTRKKKRDAESKERSEPPYLDSNEDPKCNRKILKRNTSMAWRLREGAAELANYKEISRNRRRNGESRVIR